MSKMSIYNITYEEMYQAYLDCRKRKKSSPGAKKFGYNALYNVVALCNEINAGRYRLKPASCFIVEYPTKREVFCAAFRDRVVQHFVFNELNPIIEKKLINDTASCRVGKGTDYAIKRVTRFVRSATNNYKDKAYYLKFDLSGFFMAIDRNLLFKKINDLIVNYYNGQHKAVLQYLCKIIITTDVTKGATILGDKSLWDDLPARKTLFNNPYGLAIGNITSQLFANYYLNDVDHYIKSRHRYYERYVDDGVIIDTDKEKLKETLLELQNRLNPLHEKLNLNKTIISKVEYGIQFLGIIIKPYYNTLSSKRINRLYYTTSLIKDPKKMYLSASSRKGMFERYHGYNVSNRWYNQLPDDIKNNLVQLPDYKYKLMENNINV